MILYMSLWLYLLIIYTNYLNLYGNTLHNYKSIPDLLIIYNILILVRLTSLTSPNLTQYNILIHMHLYNNSEVEVEKRFL